MKTIANVRVGKPDVSPTLPSHVAGVRGGNEPCGMDEEKGIVAIDGKAVATGRRSTGINAKAKLPIDPKMPKLTPS